MLGEIDMQIMRSMLRPDLTFMGLGKLLLIFFLLVAVILWRSPNLPKAFFYSIIRELSKGQMALKTLYWPELTSEHFVVKYQAGDEAGAKLVFESAEKFYQPVIKELGLQPPGRVRIVVYPSRESLGKSFGWTADESAMGVYWAGSIRVLSPDQWVVAATSEERKQSFDETGPIAHEFAHLLVDYQTRGNYTRWFTEALALYTEYKVTGFRFQGVFSGQLYPLASMDKNFDNLPDQNLAYRQSFAAIQYLVENYGEDKLPLIMDYLRQGKTLNQAFEEALGVQFDVFEKGFNYWVNERGTI